MYLPTDESHLTREPSSSPGLENLSKSSQNPFSVTNEMLKEGATTYFILFSWVSFCPDTADAQTHTFRIKRLRTPLSCFYYILFLT